MTSQAARSGWAEILRRLQADYGTYGRIGEAVGAHENSVQNWMTKGMLPDFQRETAIASALKLPDDEVELLRKMLDLLRREYYLRRVQTHPLALGVERVSSPFRPRRVAGGGAAAQAAPAGRGYRDTEAQGAVRRRRRASVDPHGQWSTVDVRRLIGHQDEGLAEAA